MSFSARAWIAGQLVTAADLIDLENRVVAGAVSNMTESLEPVGVAGGLRGEVVPQGVTGIWGPATRTLSANGRTWILRYSPTRNFDITLAAIDLVTVATADDSIEIAVYNSDLTSRLATSGVQAGRLITTLGARTVPLVYSFAANTVYYIAATMPIGTQHGAVVSGRATSGRANTLFGAAVPNGLAGFIDAQTSPLPTSITAGSVDWTSLNTFPLIALREV